jgi:hypothetical protein
MFLGYFGLVLRYGGALMVWLGCFPLLQTAKEINVPLQKPTRNDVCR